ncbi:hypothetical protein NDU88_005575 [Pleurodeles waltl]|uniref:Uncharacterized protein n=1 Tax=Pleurodeles waltl TaxID=8319 RepID=A0AAV7UJ80_PLEWA|nr:hypothetical protein NDU88_005575 [Pleurodeles waltl]
MRKPRTTSATARNLHRVVPMTSKAQRKQSVERKPLTFQHPTRTQDAMEPELQVLPMLLYLLLNREQQGRRRQPKVQDVSCSLRQLPTGDDSHVSCGALSEHVAGLVAVVAAVSVAVVHVSAPVGGHSRMSPAASDGCPLGMMLGSVAEAADVQLVVQVAVSTAIQVDVVVDRRDDSGPSAGASVPCADLLFALCPFPTFDGAAVPLALSPFGLEEPLLGGWCGVSLRHVGTFFTLAGGGMACSLALLGGTLAALMGAGRDVTGLAETTVLDDLVAEVVGWDLDSLALGEGRGGGVGKRSM